MHIKLKHPSVTYNENYQQQARNAAMLAEKYAQEEDDELSDEDIPVVQTRESFMEPPQKRLTRCTSGPFALPSAVPQQSVMFSQPVMSQGFFSFEQGMKRKGSESSFLVADKEFQQPQPIGGQAFLEMGKKQVEIGSNLSHTNSRNHPMQINFICK